MVVITDPIVVNVGESAVVQCSAIFSPDPFTSEFADPNAIVLRRGGLLFTDERLTSSVDERVKTFVLRDVELSDNSTILQCSIGELMSPVVTLQVHCESNSSFSTQYNS